MKKIFFGILITAIIGLLSGCIVTDNHDKYETKRYHSTNEISEIMITDISTNITIQSSDSNDVLVEYSDSPTDEWYNIDVTNNVLKIEKTRETVGVEDNSVVISLPIKEYKSISIETTNGDIILSNISSEKYKCFTENGNIKGTIKGKEKEYLIVTKTENGNSNLEDNVIESSKTMELNTKNGDVKINFSE